VDKTLAKLAVDITKDWAFTLEQGKKWAQETIGNPYDYKLFYEKPLFMVDHWFYPVSSKALNGYFYKGTYRKIRECFPKEDISFNNFYGRSFEYYCKQIMHFVCKKHEDKYQVIDEFKYKYKQNQHDSPDLFIKKGNKLLCIELKSYKTSLEAQTETGKEHVEKAINRIIIEPLEKTCTRIKELIEIKSPTLIAAKEIYILNVSIDPMPFFRELSNRVLNIIREKQKEIPIKTYVHLSIEEYELFCELLSKGENVFKLLNYFTNNIYNTNASKTKNNQNWFTFKNFCGGKHIIKGTSIPEYCINESKEYYDKFKEMFAQ
jgi:hypothetical protein